MSATPTEDQVQDVQAEAVDEAATDTTAAVASVEEAFEAEEMAIPEDVPSADDPSSRANPRQKQKIIMNQIN